MRLHVSSPKFSSPKSVVVKWEFSVLGLGPRLVITLFLSLHNGHREGIVIWIYSFINHNVKLTRLLQPCFCDSPLFANQSFAHAIGTCLPYELSTPRLPISTPTPCRTASSRRTSRIVVLALTTVAGTVGIWNRSSTPGVAVAAPVVCGTASCRGTCRIVVCAQIVVTAAVRSNSRTRPTPRCAVTTPVFCWTASSRRTGWIVLNAKGVVAAAVSSWHEGNRLGHCRNNEEEKRNKAVVFHCCCYWITQWVLDVLFVCLCFDIWCRIE
jgi:hypothetical protein